jgi:uncharacterized protein
VHQDGLVHVSQLADRFVKDPNEVVKVGDRIKVRVVEVDLQRKRIALTAKKGAAAGQQQQQGGGGQRRKEPARGGAPQQGKNTSNTQSSSGGFRNNPFADKFGRR